MYYRRMSASIRPAAIPIPIDLAKRLLPALGDAPGATQAATAR